MNLNSYTVSFKLSFLLIFGAGISIIILVIGTYVSFNQYVEENLKQTSVGNAVVIEKTINDLQIKASQISVLISNLDIVKVAYRNPDSKLGSEQLMTNFKPILNNLKQIAGVDKIEIHFHKPGAKSFLRVWTNKRGDDLSKFRSTILEVERTKNVVKGIELGVGGFAIRGLAPIFDNGQYIGSCEMFYNPIDVINFLSLDKEKAGALFLVAEATASALFEKKVLDENYPSSHSGLLISKFSNDKIHASDFLNDDFFANLDKSKSNAIEINNYSVTTIPINDFSGNPLGFFVLSQNIQSNYKDMYYKIFFLVIIFFITFTVVNITTLLIIRNTIIKPITLVTNMAKKIARGDLKI